MGHVRADEVVASALRDSLAGMSDAENAAKHGVAVKTIRRWRRLYQRRGQPRGQAHLLALCPRCDSVALDRAAYAELFGWYLGDGYITLDRRGVYSLHIYNDMKYVDLNERIKLLMTQVKPGCRPHARTMKGCLNTTVSWKHWPCLMPQHGPGMKHQRKLVLENWQREIIEEHPAEFLRGLFHSDGCRANNWARRPVAGKLKRYEYPRWMFSNNSSDIMAWCQDALDLLDIPWRMPRWNCLAVSTRAGVAKLDQLIGVKT